MQVDCSLCFNPTIQAVAVYTDTAIRSLLSFLQPTWPQVALLLLVLLGWKFKTPFTQLIDRIEFAGPSGVKLRAPSQPNNPLPKTAAPSTPPVPGELPIIAVQKQNIINDLNHNPLYAHLDEEQKKQVLIQNLAFFQFSAWFEREYRDIFGSQIRLLKILQQRRPDGISKIDVQKYIESLASQYPKLYENGEQFSSPDVYMAFLKATGAVREENDTYFVEDLGSGFLIWLAASGLSEEKFG